MKKSITLRITKISKNKHFVLVQAAFQIIRASKILLKYARKVVINESKKMPDQTESSSDEPFLSYVQRGKKGKESMKSQIKYASSFRTRILLFVQHLKSIKNIPPVHSSPTCTNSRASLTIFCAAWAFVSGSFPIIQTLLSLPP